MSLAVLLTRACSDESSEVYIGFHTCSHVSDANWALCMLFASLFVVAWALTDSNMLASGPVVAILSCQNARRFCVCEEENASCQLLL